MSSEQTTVPTKMDDTKKVIPRNKTGHVKTKLAATHHTRLAHEVKKHFYRQVAVGDAWTVQLGSFSQKNNAEKLVKELRSKGFAAYVNRAKNGATYVNRVYVGPELKRANADQLVKKLHAAFQLKGVVVKYKV